MACRPQIILYDQGSGSTEVALVRYSAYKPKAGGSKAKPINQFEVSTSRSTMSWI